MRGSKKRGRSQRRQRKTGKRGERSLDPTRFSNGATLSSLAGEGGRLPQSFSVIF
jgi:hypothetical protein